MDSIESVSHLEVLLMLYKDPAKNWDAEKVCKELRSSLSSATKQLESLTSKGLISTTDSVSYHYLPLSPELDEKVRTLFDLYQKMPVAIVTCIYEKPTDKLKNFSEAFRIKKD